MKVREGNIGKITKVDINRYQDCYYQCIYTVLVGMENGGTVQVC